MKLVRDRIPEIIIEDGCTPIYHIAEIPELKRELYNKVIEELNEFREDPCLEEASDILEVIYTLFEAYELDFFEISSAGIKKNALIGAFHRGIILEKINV